MKHPSTKNLDTPCTFHYRAGAGKGIIIFKVDVKG